MREKRQQRTFHLIARLETTDLPGEAIRTSLAKRNAQATNPGPSTSNRASHSQKKGAQWGPLPVVSVTHPGQVARMRSISAWFGRYGGALASNVCHPVARYSAPLATGSIGL